VAAGDRLAIARSAWFEGRGGSFSRMISRSEFRRRDGAKASRAEDLRIPSRNAISRQDRLHQRHREIAFVREKETSRTANKPARFANSSLAGARLRSLRFRSIRASSSFLVRKLCLPVVVSSAIEGLTTTIEDKPLFHPLPFSLGNVKQEL
jgi:hypothetical protein